MESITIGLQDVANLVVFIAPGYFACRTYSTVHSKGDKSFSRILIESAVFSLPIVAIYNVVWHSFTDQVAASTSVKYVLPLLILSFLVGLLFARLRAWRWPRSVARRFGFPDADEDFIHALFNQLSKNEAVTVRLKNGSVFSGTPQGGSTYRNGSSRQYYFNNVAWYNDSPKAKTNWEERPGSLIIDLEEVMYMETAKALPKD